MIFLKFVFEVKYSVLQTETVANNFTEDLQLVSLKIQQQVQSSLPLLLYIYCHVTLSFS